MKENGAVGAETLQKGLAHQMLECLEELHKQGIVHNDVKWSHFLLFGRRGPKLIDFDQASVARSWPPGSRCDRWNDYQRLLQLLFFFLATPNEEVVKREGHWRAYFENPPRQPWHPTPEYEEKLRPMEDAVTDAAFDMKAFVAAK